VGNAAKSLKLEVELMAARRVEIIAGRSCCCRLRLKRFRGGISRSRCGRKNDQHSQRGSTRQAMRFDEDISPYPMPHLLLFRVFTSSEHRGFGSVSSEFEENQLARQVDDPTAILTQPKSGDLSPPWNFQKTAHTNAVQLRPVCTARTVPSIYGDSLAGVPYQPVERRDGKTRWFCRVRDGSAGCSGNAKW
jgi:hypothetical protein